MVGPEGKAPLAPGSSSPRTTTTTRAAARRLVSGTPPPPGLHYGYFENRYGEHFALAFAQQTDEVQR
jgi:hypothetical protein